MKFIKGAPSNHHGSLWNRALIAPPGPGFISYDLFLGAVGIAFTQALSNSRAWVLFLCCVVFLLFVIIISFSA